MLWPKAAKKGREWYREVVEAAEWFMAMLFNDRVEQKTEWQQQPRAECPETSAALLLEKDDVFIY